MPARTTATPRCRRCATSSRGPGGAYWLNPERRSAWDTGDSVAAEYGRVVPMVECRNLAQLGTFVHELA